MAGTADTMVILRLPLLPRFRIKHRLQCYHNLFTVFVNETGGLVDAHRFITYGVVEEQNCWFHNMRR